MIGDQGARRRYERQLTQPSELTRAHRRRLFQLWRSAGWPYRDALELDLIQMGLVCLEPSRRPGGAESLRLSETGKKWLQASLRSNREAYHAHQSLVRRVAQCLSAAGRLCWTGLSVRARLIDPVATWRLCRPDVFSIRRTSSQARLEPEVHEIKAHRADLLADLRKPAKRAAYLALSARCWYVLGRDASGRVIADPSEIPDDCGVVIDAPERLQSVRPAPVRPCPPPTFAVWMALAAARPFEAEESLESPQLDLVAFDTPAYASEVPHLRRG